MTRRVSAVHAKAQLADCLRKAEAGEPVIITRHGKPVAALVAVDHVGTASLRGPSARSGLAALVGGWNGSAELVKALRKLRRTSPRRRNPLD
jgi:prevent-host-death family protein